MEDTGLNIHDTIRYQNIGPPDDILRRKLWAISMALSGSSTSGLGMK